MRMIDKIVLSTFLAVGVVAAPCSAAAAAETGDVEGTVRSTLDGAVPGVQVRLPGTTHVTVSDADGGFHFGGLRPGTYLVQAESTRFGTASASVDVAAGETATVSLTLDLVIHGDEVVVTASADPRTLSELAQPVGVLTGDELTLSARPSLGETLSDEPGVHSTFFGAGASRPVIRGQGGNRIRILENGVDSGDVSDTSPDHAVAVDPFSADKVEVVRGPATLLYGSNAIGGVVNVIDDRIPEYLPTNPIEGSVSVVGSSNANERGGGVDLGGGGGKVAWSLSGFKRETDDYESGEGVVVNSAVEADGGSAGLSVIGDKGFLGAAVRTYDSTYGNPAEEEVHLELEQRRLDLRGGTSARFGIFDGARFRFGLTDYEHTEFEGDEVGTRFLNDAWEARIDSTHRQVGAFRGSVGIQLSTRSFEAIGEEAFVPPTDNDTWAAFVFEEIGTGALRGQVGLRYDHQDSSATGQADRTFSAASASAGLVWSASTGYTTALTLSRAVKLPDPEELYANGPHIATQVFEIGDPDLDAETTLGVDLALRKTSGRVQGELSLFSSRSSDYIYDRLTGELVEGEEDPLPVVQFTQADAEFYGAEATAHIELLHREPQHLELELSGDMVRAELSDTGEPLPRISPARFGGGLRYRGDRFSGSLFVRHTLEQDRTAEFETPTDGYTMVDATAGYRFFTGDVVHDLLLSATNLTDEVARNHVSFLKDTALLPGRDVRLTYRLSF
ncbi:MAG: TonB-dependent receptor [Thermoanaerobaculia bacterium]